MLNYDFDELFYAWPKLNASAGFKTTPQDFIVTEHLPFELEGEGEHCWLYVEKTDSNTDWVAQKLADFAGIKPKQVGYAGLKDRQAVCRQWFSLHLAGMEDPDWKSLDNSEFRVLQNIRHRKKLQRGALKSNRFEIRLRDVKGDINSMEQRCVVISKHGVPNYFGPQRFGRKMENIRQALRHFETPRRRLARHKRSLYLSATRSWLFNRILSKRIELGCWDSRLEGDVFMLDGKRACFEDDASADLAERLQAAEIHPTVALWGEGESQAKAACAELEAAVISENNALADGLCAARLEPARRASRCKPADFDWQVDGADLRLQFRLSSGAYATSVLRELISLDQPSMAIRG